MPKIVFIEHPDLGGEQRVVEATAGQSVMKTAVENSVPGIEGICGGSCSCATCHCYIEADWAAKAGPMSDMEKSMLEVALDVRPESRLSCQINISEELDGLVVHTPKTQT